MARYKLAFVFIHSIISLCVCEIEDNQKRIRLVNGFVEFYNSLPNEIYTCDEGILQSAQQTDISNAYDIVVNLKVSDPHNLDTTKYLKCTATVADIDVGVAVMKHHCQEDPNAAENPVNMEEKLYSEPYSVTETSFVRKPIQLDNEVQTDIGVASGEQFIAIPREDPKVHCIGCSSHVNPQAEGVSELAGIGVRQLNSLEPNIQHTLSGVVDVERQVQVVNGVRFILTLIIDYNSCSKPATEPCLTSKVCKITILEKPWMHLPDGSKYRAILSNNCTEEWRFGDDGVVVPSSDNKENNNINPTNPEGGSDIIKAVHNVDIQSQQQTEKSLTDQDVKNLEEQIIPLSQFEPKPTQTEPTSSTPEPSEVSKEHVVKIESENQYSPNSIQTNKPQKVEKLDDDKKKTIDELMNFFNIAGFDTNTSNDEAATRTKRSFDSDLNAMNIAEKFKKIKRNIENAKHIYTLAQNVVDYLNEMDLEVKRVLKDVINAEKETEKHNTFYYIQFRIIVPCKTNDCKSVVKICNAIIDNSEKDPQILNVFCHDEDKRKLLDKLNSVPVNDPVLHKLIKVSIKNIETESQNNQALKLNKVIEASTQRVSGTLTKFSIVLDQTNCDKSVPFELRTNCSIVEEYGSQICDVTIHERHWLKERSITFSCTDRPLDIRFSEIRNDAVEKRLNDPVVLDMVQEALKNLEQQTNTNNKQIVVRINSVSTQLVSGFLTEIEFIVGLSTCPSYVKIEESGNCRLLENEPLKTCTAKVWDRTWMEDGRKVEVSCEEPNIESNEIRKKNVEPANIRAKRGIPGGAQEQDPNEPTYRVLAEESLQKYFQDTGNTQLYKDLEIEKVSTQVVAGKLTKIKFKVSPIPQTSGDVIKCDSEIWEKPWLNKKEIKVSCEIDNANVRTKRGLPGGVQEQDPNEPTYRVLAEESLQKYFQDTGNTQLYKDLEIEKVSTQVVAGKLTKIKFKVSPIPQTSGDVIKCDSEIWEKPWLNKKEIKVSCQIDNANVRTKRGLPGGVQEQDPNEPKYKVLAEESLQKYFQDTGNTQLYKDLEIEKVSTQVVAGKLTKIKFKVSPIPQTSGDVIKCDSEIWEKPWLNKKEIKVSCQIDNANVRTKRGVPGGVQEQDPNEPKYKVLAEESLQKYFQDTGNTQLYKDLEIEKVSTQVVAGKLTKIKFKVSPIPQTSGDVIKCDSEIWEKPWLNKKEIKVSCQIDNANVRTKRGIPGGVQEQDPNEPKYKVLAEESLQKYLRDSGNSQPHKVVEIEKVSTQLVAGLNTVIDFKITPTDHTTGDVISCRSTIAEKQWQKNIQVNCQIDEIVENKRKVRLGGPLEKDLNDPIYKQLAEESLQKYLQNTGNSMLHRIVSIDNVTVQIVAGTKTVISFKITPIEQTTDDVITCESQIWERKWLHSKEIKVNCKNYNINNRVKRYIFTGDTNMIAGGYVDQNPKKPEYRQLAEMSLQKYLQDFGISQPHVVVNIQKASTQVVSGLRTIIDFDIAPQASTSGDVIHCKSDIWQQLWQKERKIIVNCEFDIQTTRAKWGNVEQQRHKRNIERSGLVGGTHQEDPTKKEFKELAQDSLRKYQKKQKSAKGHVVVEVKKVTTKVVSGTIYKIDFTAAPKSCAHDISLCHDENPLLNCHSEVLHRPWLLQKDIDVTCKRKKNKRSVTLNEAEENTKFDQLTEIEITELDERGKAKRQTGIDDDYIDEDTRFHYADRAIKQLNDQIRSSNLYKLITVHSVQNSMHMDKTPMVRMYIETAETFCLRSSDTKKLSECEEMDGNDHKLCLARLWPSPDDEMEVQAVSVVCEDDEKFESITGLSIPTLLKASIKSIEQSPQLRYKLVHQGEPHLIPSLDSNNPNKLSFIIRTTNCSKKIDEISLKLNCFVDVSKPSKACTAYIWLAPNSRTISKLTSTCAKTETRQRRSVTLNSANATADEIEIQDMVKESLEKLEMTTPQRYKQKVLKINSYSTQVTSGRVTTIDFDVGFTSCLKYEWVDDTNTCELLEHLPRRHCVSEVWERLWLNNGRNIEVKCEDEDVPLEAHIEFESTDVAMALADRALKHIEAKYPHPRKQKVVRIYSLDKQVVAGVHYRMKMEVGVTNCSALSGDQYCVIDKKGGSENKFCRVNVWLRPWTEQPPNFRVTCDYQEGAMADLYHQVQAEHLFRDFLAMFSPEYINDHDEMLNRFEIFKANIRRIHELNIHERGTATYGVTRFTDLTYEEFTNKHMGLKQSLRDANQVPMRMAQIPSVDIPENFDWREKGTVTPVKDQGSCGSCWAFSVTGNIEGQWQIKSGKLVSLSEQELVDCDKIDDGCNGGLPDNAYRAIEQLGGLETELDYPYEGEDDKCAFNRSLSRVQITGAVNITSNETDMAKWLVKNGPISIGINANAMQFYMGGISHPWKMLCSASNLDHGVLIVGYGIKNYPLFHKRLPYWIVKNSWGPSWGENGYYRVFRGDGTCGVNKMASSAVV